MSLIGKLFGAGPKVLPTHVRSVEDFTREVLEAKEPVVVDVWSETCAPCKQLAPVLVKLATKYRERVRVVELSTASAQPALLSRLGVRATPTILVFDRGREVGRMTGFRPLSWFDEMIATEFPEA
ncbi:MAG: thioredoxin family protein [Myxococcales bacterium]|nr:thioredoxin family protein [Myxococcales bacterium]